PNSRQNLRSRVRYHMRGNAEGSTLRRTLGILLAGESNFPLRRVGSGRRMTLSRDGEHWLNDWLDRNALVCWHEHPEPWVLEEELIGSVYCPLNIHRNQANPFHTVLRQKRLEALAYARLLPIVS